MCCWLWPSHAADQLAWYENLDTGDSKETTAGLVRVGAAALVASVPNVAVRAAATLSDRSIDLDKLREWLLSDTVRTYEDFNSRLRGEFLGTSPSDALANFLDFARTIYSLSPGTAAGT